jgi:hypothetical protein
VTDASALPREAKGIRLFGYPCASRMSWSVGSRRRRCPTSGDRRRVGGKRRMPWFTVICRGLPYVATAPILWLQSRRPGGIRPDCSSDGERPPNGASRRGDRGAGLSHYTGGTLGGVTDGARFHSRVRDHGLRSGCAWLRSESSGIPQILNRIDSRGPYSRLDHGAKKGDGRRGRSRPRCLLRFR